jgi:hypothetical protein
MAQDTLGKWVPGMPKKPEKWRHWKRILNETDKLISSFDCDKVGTVEPLVEAVIKVLKKFGIRDWDEDLLAQIAIEMSIEIAVNENTASNCGSLVQHLVIMFDKNRDIFNYVYDLHPDLWSDILGASEKIDPLVPKCYR